MSEHPCIFHYGVSCHSVPPHVFPVHVAGDMSARGRGCVCTHHAPHPCQLWTLGQYHRQKTLQKIKISLFAFIIQIFLVERPFGCLLLILPLFCELPIQSLFIFLLRVTSN